MRRQTLCALWLLLCLQVGCASPEPLPQASAVLQTKPYLDSKEFTSTIPIETWESKIFLRAEVNGRPYRFILDTGSPTILTQEVAEELDLEIKGTNTGKDANGNLVAMDLSILDRLQIGGVSFRNIPVFVFDASTLETGHCFLDGGIIGSEIMPLCTWQINFQKQQLVLASDSRNLDYVESASKAKLKVTQYPFYPVLEYQINGEFTDHAMFDTGNSELLHLNHLASEELTKRKLIPANTESAFGTFGESAGGRGKDETFHLIPLKQLSIGDLRFEDVQVWTRKEVPSLIGAKVFESHVVTLDYANEAIYFHRYREPIVETPSFGFRPYLKNRSVYVGWVRESSPAAQAGVQLHDQILTMNQRDLRDIPSSELCDIVRWLPDALRLNKLEIVLERNEVVSPVVLRRE